MGESCAAGQETQRGRIQENLANIIRLFSSALLSFPEDFATVIVFAGDVFKALFN